MTRIRRSLNICLGTRSADGVPVKARSIARAVQASIRILLPLISGDVFCKMRAFAAREKVGYTS